MNWIFEPWPWYIGGVFIAFTMLLLLMLGKKFGMSSNLRTLCTICGAGNHSDFFKFNWKVDRWNLLVALGAIKGGFIAASYMSNSEVVVLQKEVAS